MNVLFLARRYYPHIGGVEKHVREVSRKLIERGHVVKVITEQYGLKLKDQEFVEKAYVTRIKPGNKWTTWKEIWKIRHLLLWADVIHAHDVYYWIIPFRLLHPFKRTYVTFHGWEEKYPIPTKNIAVRKISELLANGNICVGEYITKWYKTKADFITYGAV